jgi:cytochrome c
MKNALWSSLAALSFSLACGGGASAPPNTASSEAAAAAPAESPAPATFADQVALGQTLYGDYCAKCHGASGEGGGAPAVVGLDKGALPLDPPESRKFRKTKFETVADVAAFVVKNMPPGKGGTLTDEQYYAILAFEL